MITAGRISHVRNKVVYILPAFANFYTPAAIINKVVVLGIRTPPFHPIPSIIYGRFAKAMTKTYVAFAKLFFLITTARLGCAVPQTARVNNFYRAAIAFTKKTGVFVFRVFSTRQNNETAKPFIDNINVFWHVIA